MDISVLENRLKTLNKQVYIAQGEKDRLEKQKNKWEKEISDTKENQRDLVMKKTLLEHATEEARESGKRVLSETSTHAVQMVMDGDLEVDMHLSQKRGVANADLIIRKDIDGLTLETDPAQEEGGGMADIVSVATFMSMGMLVGDENKAPYFLDEPTKYVSKGNSNNVAKFLKELVAYSGKQTILVTHDEVVAQSGNKTFKVEMDKDGTSHVEEVD